MTEFVHHSLTLSLSLSLSSLTDLTSVPIERDTSPFISSLSLSSSEDTLGKKLLLKLSESTCPLVHSSTRPPPLSVSLAVIHMQTRLHTHSTHSLPRCPTEQNQRPYFVFSCGLVQTFTLLRLWALECQRTQKTPGWLGFCWVGNDIMTSCMMMI